MRKDVHQNNEQASIVGVFSEREGFNIRSSINPRTLFETEHKDNPQREEAHELTEDLLNMIELKDKIGEGGMGIVYSAQQFFPRREVAVKKLRDDRGFYAKTLMDEAMVMGELTHPNIPPIYRVDLDENGIPEVVMKKIEGQSFENILGGEPQRDLKLRDALQILIQVCYAVEYAHSQGFLHRDIKPENIMVGKFNQVYLMDWGITINMLTSFQNRKGLAGTPAYMAPEMLLGDPTILTEATDIYLLGAMLHEILTGEPRNKGETLKETIQAVNDCIQYEYSSDVPHLLADLCNWACTREAVDRPQSVFEFRESLEEFLEYWEAIKFLEKGERLLKAYRELWEASKDEVVSNQQLFNQISFRAKFYFEQAIDFWGESKEAEKGLIDLLALMIEQALYEKKFHRVILLLEEYPKLYRERPDLIKRYEEEELLWKEAEKRLGMLEKLQKDWDPSVTRRPRRYLRRVVMVCLVFGVVFFSMFQRNQGIQFGVEERFYVSFLVAFPMWIAVAVLYKRLTVNVWGQMVTRTVLYGSLIFVLSRAVSMYFGIEPNLVAIFDCIFLSVTMSNSYPMLRSGVWLGLLGVFATIGTTIFPSFSQIIFALFCTTIGIVASMEWRQRTKRHAKLEKMMS